MQRLRSKPGPSRAASDSRRTGHFPSQPRQPAVPSRPGPTPPEAQPEDEASRKAALSAKAREAVAAELKLSDLSSIVLWTNDLGITSPRQRGLKRGQYALIMLVLGTVFVALPITAIKPVAIAPLIYGAIALAVAVVELITNRNWMDNPILLRLLFLLVLIPLSVILALAFGVLGLVISNGLTDLFK